MQKFILNKQYWFIPKGRFLPKTEKVNKTKNFCFWTKKEIIGPEQDRWTSPTNLLYLK